MIGFYAAGGMGSGGGGASDPYWANVASLLHFDGSNGSTTFTDQTGKSWSASGDARLSTTGPKFGSACAIFEGSGDYISTSSHADFGFADGDYTVEGWAYRSIGASDRCMFDNRSGVATGIAIYSTVISGGAGGLAVASNTAVMARDASAPPSNIWYHWAVARQSGTVRGFVGGALVFTVADSRTYASSAPCVVGASSGLAQLYIGLLDEVRVTKGVARYTAAFTPPSAPFPDS